MPRRNVRDKWQQRSAWHELGHGLLCVKLGLKFGGVIHTVTGGWTDVSPPASQWREDAIMSVGGSEGEWMLEKYHNLWFGSRWHCQSDMMFVRKAIQGRSYSEGKARSEARKVLLRHRDLFEELAPHLILEGRLTPRDFRRAV